MERISPMSTPAHTNWFGLGQDPRNLDSGDYERLCKWFFGVWQAIDAGQLSTGAQSVYQMFRLR